VRSSYLLKNMTSVRVFSFCEGSINYSFFTESAPMLSRTIETGIKKPSVTDIIIIITTGVVDAIESG